MSSDAPAPRIEVPSGKLTWADFRELPPDGKRYELRDGVLHLNPAPRTAHQRVLSRLFTALSPLAQRGVAEVFFAPLDVVLDESNVVEPDLILVRAERAAIIEEDAIHGAPDLVVEVLSPSTRRTDVRTKALLYARSGIPVYWLVDPDVDELVVLRLEGERYVEALRAAAPALVTPLGAEGLALDLGALFRR